MFFTYTIQTRIIDAFERRLKGPIKLRILQHFVESEGFFLGDYGNLLGASIGPLLICQQRPMVDTHILVTALHPGAAVDALDVLGAEPFVCVAHQLPSVKHPVFLQPTISILISDAVRAIDRLKRYQVTEPTTRRSAHLPN